MGIREDINLLAQAWAFMMEERKALQKANVLFVRYQHMGHDHHSIIVCIRME